ncbi:MAG TPA: glycine zipper 2TM domain-containing protein [Sphingobium sp.]
MTFKIWKVAIAAGAAAATLMPLAAQAHGEGRHRGWNDRDRYERSYRPSAYRGGYDDRRYYRGRGCKTSGTTGLVLGGVAGALLGRSIDRYGDRAPGTIIGAGAGALLGREIDSKRRC